MKIDAKWIGKGWGYPKRYALKSDAGKLQPGQRLIRLEFRFEVAYALFDHEHRVLMDGNGLTGLWCPTWDFYLTQFGRVIGPQDMAAADNSPMAEAWRNCAVEKRLQLT